MNVKLARIKLNMTQEQLRKEIKVSTKKIVAIERGDYSKLTYENMQSISNVLGISIVDLFFSE